MTKKVLTFGLLGLLGFGAVAIAEQVDIPGAVETSELNAIIGGESALSGAWPSVVAITRSGSGSLYHRQFCVGNLIDQRWVITAAHCLHSEDTGVYFDVATLRVASGVTDLTSAGVTEHVIVNSYIHPLYSPYSQLMQQDIALLELATDADGEPMQISTQTAESLAGRSAVLAGWGATQYVYDPGFEEDGDARSFPTVLQQATLPIVPLDTCNSSDSYQGYLNAGQMCAGFAGGGIDACAGDSGGPLMVRDGSDYRQIGLVSFGIGCALPDWYGVYTDLNYYADWIDDYVDIGGGFTLNQPMPAGSGDERSGSLSFWWLVVVSLFVWIRQSKRWRQQAAG